MEQKKIGGNNLKQNKIVKKIERFIIMTLIAMMSVLLLLATVELAYHIIMMVVNSNGFLFDLDGLMNTFGVFMIVLIGIELLDTIKVYFKEHIIHVEVVMLVAIIAIARKVIIMEIEDLTGEEILGIAAIIIALSAGYFLIKKTGGAGFWPVEKEEEKDITIEEKALGGEVEEKEGEEKVIERKKTIKTKSQENIAKNNKEEK